MSLCPVKERCPDHARRLGLKEPRTKGFKAAEIEARVKELFLPLFHDHCQRNTYEDSYTIYKRFYF